MTQNSDPNLVSIQFRVAGKQTLLRNALIGMVIGVSFGTAAATSSLLWPLEVLFVPLVGGLIMGGFTAVMAMLVQMIASKSYEGQRQLRWPAIRSAGWIAGCVGVFLTGTNLTGSVHSFDASLLIATVSAIVGALIMAALTLSLNAIKRALPTGSAAQLGEGQFDPLRNIENRERERR